jgi:hypothetical protein
MDEITAVQVSMSAVLLLGFLPVLDVDVCGLRGKCLGCMPFLLDGVMHVITWSGAYYFNYHYGNDPTNDWYYAIPIGFALFVVLACVLYHHLQHRENFWSYMPSGIPVLGAIIFIMAGFYCFQMSRDHANTTDLWYHGAWHMCAAVAIGLACWARKWRLFWSQNPTFKKYVLADGNNIDEGYSEVVDFSLS